MAARRAPLAQLTKAQCTIIDFRSYHPNDHVGAAHAVNEALPPRAAARRASYG